MSTNVITYAHNGVETHLWQAQYYVHLLPLLMCLEVAWI